MNVKNNNKNIDFLYYFNYLYFVNNNNDITQTI